MTSGTRPDFDTRRVRPDGLAIRGRRHARGWSRRELCKAIQAAQIRATGVPESLTPNLLVGIEEHNEIIPFATLCLVAAGLDCNPVEIEHAVDAESEILDAAVDKSR